MTKKIIKVGSRESALAMWQTEFVIDCLKEKTSAYDFAIVPIKTKGDKILDVSLAKVGDKGLFTKELEIAMLAGEIDFAVHSMKDVPTQIVEGLIIGAVLKRHDPSDVLISKGNIPFKALPKGAKVGTSSLRRRAQLLYIRPDLNIADVRGNLNTRVRKMAEENFDALILAAAGVERLGWQEKISERLSFDIMLPAVSQGAIGVEARDNDKEILDLLALINDDNTAVAIKAERALLGALEGGCQIPIAAHAQLNGDSLTLEGLVGSLDGKAMIREKLSGQITEAEQLGRALADILSEKGAKEILANIRLEMN